MGEHKNATYNNRKPFQRKLGADKDIMRKFQKGSVLKCGTGTLILINSVLQCYTYEQQNASNLHEFIFYLGRVGRSGNSFILRVFETIVELN